MYVRTAVRIAVRTNKNKPGGRAIERASNVSNDAPRGVAKIRRRIYSFQPFLEVAGAKRAITRHRF